MITQTPVHTQGNYTVVFNAQVNAYRPFSVINNTTGKTEFAYNALSVCLDYISDNA